MGPVSHGNNPAAFLDSSCGFVCVGGRKGRVVLEPGSAGANVVLVEQEAGVQGRAGGKGATAQDNQGSGQGTCICSLCSCAGCGSG